MLPSESKIVVIGGGTGNHTTLTGLKKRNCQLTAIVSMSDDGGSSGRLRDELGQLPPGDIRQCLVALAADDYISAQLRKLFNYRFTSGQGLNGHSFGNLFISALTDITGNSATAISEASRMLHIKGSVFPVTLTPTILKAKLVDGTVIDGESQIGLRSTMHDSKIDYVYLEPAAYPYPPVIDAIEEADAIVIGPGDIYTSILPNLLVKEVSNAINRSPAIKIYVCNLMTKPGESDGFAASDFLTLVQSYLHTDDPIDCLLMNDVRLPQPIKDRYLSVGQKPVELDINKCNKLAKHIKQAPLLKAEVYLRHNQDALADAIIELIDDHKSSVS